jgi:predicted transcriptional regulator
MKLSEIVEILDLEILSGPVNADAEAEGAYVADLLSCVMAGAQENQLWFTLQTYLNIVAVASLTGLAAIVVTEGAPVADETLAKAETQDVIVLRSQEPTFEALTKLIQAGF